MKKIKTGIIGVGFIGTAHIEALRRLGNVDIVALADEFHAKEKAEQLNIPHVFSNYKDMIDEVPLDTIHICTPNYTHYEIAKYAIQKNLHVICEKPFTTTIEEAQNLVSLCKDKGVVNAVNFHNRFYPMTHHLRQMIAKGELGEIYSVHGGYLQDWLLYDTDFNWRLISTQAGKSRAVADIGSHWLDLVEYLTGLQITQVFAEFKTVHPTRKQPLEITETFAKQNSISKYKEIPIDTEDFACFIFKLSNGSLGNATISQTFAGKKNKMSVFVAGSKMSAEWDSDDTNNLIIGRRDKPNLLVTKDPSMLDSASSSLVSYPSGHVEGFPDTFKQGFKQIYGSISDPNSPSDYATFEDGLREMIICERIYESATNKKWVNI